MKWKPGEKSTFLTAFFGGLTAHLYIYTNTIPNFDGISRVYDEQQMTVSGRWFLHYASYLHGFTQSPMVIGVLALLFLAMTAVVVVRLLEIKSPLFGGIWGILSVVAPPVAYTNTYTFTVSAYCLAIFLAAAAVWLAGKGKWGFLGGAVLLAFSMGTYQAYVTVAITLSVLLVLKEALSLRSNVKGVVTQGVRYILFLSTGTVLYYLILKIFLKVKNLRLLSYLGMNQVENGYPVDRIGNIIADAYSEVGSFFFSGYATSNFTAVLIKILAVVLLSVTLIILVGRIFKEGLWRNPAILAGIIILILLLPAAVNFAKCLSPFSPSRMTMKYTYIYICLLPILLADESIYEKVKGEAGGFGRKVCTISLIGSIMLLSYQYWQWDNVLYTMLGQAHRATLSFVTNVVGRIESCAGYESGMPVIIVGGFPADRYDTDINVYEYVKDGGALSSSVIPLNKHIYYYMNDWLNVPIEEPSEEEFFLASEFEEFQEMPLYPDDGSVRIMDGRVIVKMQEQFMPKAQYEKDYEERR